MAGVTRARMTRRCVVERDASLGTGASADPLNAPVAPFWASHLTDVPCYYFEPSGQRGEIVGVRNADVYAPRLLIPTGLDVTEADRINGIFDRDGVRVLDRVLSIEQIVRKRDHWLLVTGTVES